MMAGNDLANAGIETGGGVLDAGDDAAQLRDRRVGIIAHAREHALQLTLHAHAEVTTGQRSQQCLQVAEVGFKRRQQAVDAGRQRAHEALLALQRDATVQVAVCCSIDQGSDLGFQQGLQRTTAPFHRYAEELPFIDDGVGNQLVTRAGMADLALFALAHAGQAGQRRMQAYRVAAHQRFVPQVKQLQQCRVGVGDLPFRIDHHQTGLCTVQCLAHPGVAARHGTLGLDTRAQALLHVDQALRQLADLVVGVVDAQGGVQAVFSDVAGEAQGVLDRLAHRTQHQDQAGDQHAGHQQQGQCEQHAHGARAGLLACLRPGQRRHLCLLECGQRRRYARGGIQQRLRFHIQADAGRGIPQQCGLIRIHPGAQGDLRIRGQARQREIERQLFFAGAVGVGGITVEQQQGLLPPHLLQGQRQRIPLLRIHLPLQRVCSQLQLRGEAGLTTAHLVDPFEQGGNTLRERVCSFGQRLQGLAPAGIHRHRAQGLQIVLQRLLRGQQLRAVGIIETACILDLQAARFGHPRGQARGQITAALVAGLAARSLRAGMPGPGIGGGNCDQSQATDPQGRLELVGYAQPMRLQPQQQAGRRRAQRRKPRAQGPEVGDNGRHDRLQAKGRTCIGRIQGNFRTFVVLAQR